LTKRKKRKRKDECVVALKRNGKEFYISKDLLAKEVHSIEKYSRGFFNKKERN
jgi:hypothetical protein